MDFHCNMSKPSIDKFDALWMNLLEFIFNKNYTQNNFRILIPYENCFHQGQF